MADKETLLREIEGKLKVVSEFLNQPWKAWGRLPLKRRDPELMKAYSRIQARLAQLHYHLERTDAKDLLLGSHHALVSAVSAGLSRDSAWDLAENLKVSLLYVAPDERLTAWLAAEEDEKKVAAPSWRSVFGEADFASLRKGPPDRDCDNVKARWRGMVVERLAALYEARMDSWRHDRANGQLRANYLIGVTVILGIVLGISLVLNLVTGGTGTSLATAMAAGALGSVLSGVYKLRDEMMSIRQLRSFWPALLAQPFVGATAAMLLDIVLTSGLIQFGNVASDALPWQHHAIFGFLAGFSEPFFLGVVRRLASIEPEDRGSAASSKDAANTERPPAA